MFKLMDKKIIAILRKLFLLNWPYGNIIPYLGPTVQTKNLLFARWEISHAVLSTLDFFLQKLY